MNIQYTGQKLKELTPNDQCRNVRLVIGKV